MGRKEDSPGKSRNDEQAKTSEWIIAAVSSVVVAAMTGFLLYQAFTNGTPVPALDVVVERVVATPGGYRVEIRAANNGDATASGVTIRGEVRADGQTETAEVTLDYVPAQSSQDASLMFRNDPARYRVTVRALGYTVP